MSIRKALAIVTLSLLLIPSILPGASSAGLQTESSALSLSGLQDDVQVVRDRFGVPHIFAKNDPDVYFMMGFLHAQDRFFQMDFNRRQASGTLAELLGPGPSNQVLAGDVQLRTIGLRRAALRSRDAYSPEASAVLQAYTNGVNAFLDTNPLPPEYAALELTKAGVPRWTIDDSIAVAKLITFGLSFDSGDLNNTTALGAYRAAGHAAGFDGTRLFFEDLFRSAPFDPTVSISEQPSARALAAARRHSERMKKPARPEQLIKPQTLASIHEFLKGTADNPLFSGPKSDFGSNWYVISGAKTDTGFPMLANDPHLSLISPPTFYEVHLVVNGPNQAPLNVYGVSFPGAPTLPQGFNGRIAWGSTVNPLDVTDFYQERVITDNVGRPVATFFRGTAEPLVIIPETFRVNVIGDGIPDGTVVVTNGVPPATLVVPRRNNGPLLTAPAGSPPTAISVQYSGFSPTREFETFLAFARARNLEDFKRGLQFFDVGSQNWSYMDTDGNIAYFTSAELPLREDLQAGTVDGGIPPFLVRDGTGTLRHEWIRNDNPPPDQALHFEILPFEEMPQIVNPPQGFIVNANNDPIGTSLDNNPLNQLRRGGQGILYLSPGYAIGNRAARIDTLIREELGASQDNDDGDDSDNDRNDNSGSDDDNDSDEDGTISFEDMARIQGDVQLLDAEVLTPYILRAFAAARRQDAPPDLDELARDPAIREAVGRLARWDFTTPTGIPEGFDRSDVDGNRLTPKAREVANSVAATIYSLWRGQILRNTIDVTLGRVGLGSFLPGGDRPITALRNLLDNFATNWGRGASGLNFFDVQDADLAPEVERDIILLRSLKDALNLLAGPVFAPAFGGSTDQDDYRWGRLHRIVFRHPLNAAPFNIPPGAGFTDLSPLLPGIATDGGFDVVDASNHNPRAASLNGFMFGSGPSRRFIGEARRSRVRAVEIIPGGESGVPGNPLFGNMLALWLTNEFHEAFFTTGQVMSNKVSREDFTPAK